MVEIVLNYLNHCKIILGIFILTLVIGGILCFSFCQQEHTVDSSIGLVHEPNILKEEVVEETYVYVDIKGAVKKPGVYKISNQARVNDVVKQAGGLLKTADVTYTNLSK